MEHSVIAELLSAAFLLSLGGTRYYYFLSAGMRPADRSYPAVNRALQVPAYFASAVWTVCVTWSVLAPPRLVEWDRWPLSHGVSDPLVWAAIPLFAVGLCLFWYSHRTMVMGTTGFLFRVRAGTR